MPSAAQSPETVDVVLVTALHEEYLQVREVLDEAIESRWVQGRDGPFGRVVSRRMFTGAGGRTFTVLATWADVMAGNAAAGITGILQSTFRPRCLAMTGIAAGPRGKVELGDVVFGHRVFTHDTGKLTEENFKGDLNPYRLDTLWKQRVEMFMAERNREFEGDPPPWAKERPLTLERQGDWVLARLLAKEEPSGHTERSVCCPNWASSLEWLRSAGLLQEERVALSKEGRRRALRNKQYFPDGPGPLPPMRVRLGDIGSGSAVIEDAEIFARIERSMRKTIGLEMEAAAIAAVADMGRVPWIVAKGICDFADEDKDDRFHQFAARASAECLLGFLRDHVDLLGRAGEREGTSGNAAPALVSFEPGFVTLAEDPDNPMPSPGALGQSTMPIDASARSNTTEPDQRSTPADSEFSLNSIADRLEQAFSRREEILVADEDTTTIDAEILELRRSLRRGPTLHPGEHLDNRFRLIEVIGRGGFALVWRAYDIKERRLVAIKVLHGELARELSLRERFFRGAKRMAELQHPNVVRVLVPEGEDAGFHYFVMELVSGGDLYRAVVDDKLDEELALATIESIANALAMAHGSGLVHRDVKPENILLREDGSPVLSDFDLVKAQDTTGGTRTAAMGTVVYAAPEQSIDASRVDHRSDVYSLGMTAVFCVHGKKLPLAVMFNRDVFLSKLRCTDSIRDVLKKAVALEPERRFESMMSFRRALADARCSGRHGEEPNHSDWRHQKRKRVQFMSTLAQSIVEEGSDQQLGETAIDIGGPGGSGQIIDDGEATFESSFVHEPAVAHDVEIVIGRTAGINPERVTLRLGDLATSAAFVGSTGSGKSTLVLHLIEQALEHGIPALLLDRKGDFCTYAHADWWDSPGRDASATARKRALRKRVDVAIYTPGAPRGRDLGPTIVPTGFREMSSMERAESCHQSAAAICAMLGYKGTNDDLGCERVLAKALELVGILTTEGEVRLEHVINFIADEDPSLVRVVDHLDIKHFVRLVEHLETLRLSKGDILFSQISRFDPARVLGLDRKDGKVRLSVISTKSLGDRATIDFWVARMLSELRCWSTRNPCSHLQALVMLDDADIYMPAMHSPATKRPLQDLLRRSYVAGLGVMLATQSPGDLDYKCRDSIRTWFVGRVAERAAILRMRPLFSDCLTNIEGKISRQSIGEFLMLRSGAITEVKADRGLMDIELLAEDKICALARSRG